MNEVLTEPTVEELNMNEVLTELTVEGLKILLRDGYYYLRPRVSDGSRSKRQEDFRLKLGDKMLKTDTDVERSEIRELLKNVSDETLKTKSTSLEAKLHTYKEFRIMRDDYSGELYQAATPVLKERIRTAINSLDQKRRAVADDICEILKELFGQDFDVKF